MKKLWRQEGMLCSVWVSCEEDAWGDFSNLTYQLFDNLLFGRMVQNWRTGCVLSVQCMLGESQAVDLRLQKGPPPVGTGVSLNALDPVGRVSLNPLYD